jgi:hypothetical protein
MADVCFLRKRNQDSTHATRACQKIGCPTSRSSSRICVQKAQVFNGLRFEERPFNQVGGIFEELALENPDLFLIFHF